MTETYFTYKFWSEVIPVIIALAMVAIIVVIECVKKIVNRVKNGKRVKK